MTKADDIQIDGSHYKNSSSALKGVQHWTWCYHNNYDIFQVYITKYVHRHKEKNGIRDLKKARHTLDKYIEVLEMEITQKMAEQLEVASKDREPFSEEHFETDLVQPDKVKVSGVPYPVVLPKDEIADQELQGKVHAREAQ